MHTSVFSLFLASQPWMLQNVNRNHRRISAVAGSEVTKRTSTQPIKPTGAPSWNPRSSPPYPNLSKSLYLSWFSISCRSLSSELRKSPSFQAISSSNGWSRRSAKSYRSPGRIFMSRGGRSRANLSIPFGRSLSESATVILPSTSIVRIDHQISFVVS
jgi:hypothetical protein